MESNAILIREARRILNGESFDIPKIEQLAKQLKNRNGFAYAAQLFEKLTMVGAAEKMTYYYEQLALCTYKDPDLPSSIKFDLAASFLSKIGDPLQSVNSEVLGMMGGIHKRRWMFDNQFRHLLFSRHFYQRGFEKWKEKYVDPIQRGNAKNKPVAKPSLSKKGRSKRVFNKKFKGDKKDNDAGYTAINFAFLLDLLADVRTGETRELDGALPPVITMWQERANDIRQEIVDYLTGDAIFKDEKLIVRLDNWAYATLGEAYFGLDRFDEALFFYKKYGGQKPSLWESETCRKQLLALAQIRARFAAVKPSDSDKEKKEKQARLQELHDHVRQCLHAIIPPSDESESNKLPLVMQGKVGLGLSGGGFRASLYHIGTLAKLAELDVLRHVEVLSCVSGGSIVGAHYYLLLRKKLMAKYDESYLYMHPTEKAELTLSQKDYLDIVAELTAQFMAGVQKNLRMRILSSWKNLRIFLDRKYTRSNRIGELYEEFLYKKIFKGEDGTGDYDEKVLLMQNLKIVPRGAQTFNPKTDNWDRINKVPMLVLNATTLNTGHNWQFTASWMGEPPGNIIQSVDSKPRLRRMYYDEAPAPYTNNIRLGAAVGASSCVPALFEPLYMPGLYAGVDLRLADGGVHDNQGISSLIEQECSILILSDASGQLNIENAGAGTLGSFFRSDFVLQERVRELQFTAVEARRDTNQIKGLMYIHLKRDLNKNPLKWEGCNDPTRHAWLTEDQNPNSTITQYGIQKSVQERLANLRTDLDAFNDAEAYALMYSAYRQTEWAFKESGLSEQLSTKKEACSNNWAFLPVAPFMEDAAQKKPLEKRLDVGRDLPFKVFRAYGVLTLMKTVLVVALVYGTFWLGSENWTEKIQLPPLAVKTLIFAAIGFGLDAFLGFGMSKFAEIRSFVLKKALWAIGSLFVMVLFWLYLALLNPLYLSWGKIENLRRESWLSRKWNRLLDFLF